MYDRIQDTPLKTKVLYTKTATTITGIVGTQKQQKKLQYKYKSICY